ncbi:MAG: hypothetical protein QGG36_30275 [Pirellulaceae bacterium]|jgi:WD40 repeat protein|nr:hypothetical protein [Pirellulaceae bacterium]MDP7020123.1 hypothetical protein [Pirellulaceae bacterium]
MADELPKLDAAKTHEIKKHKHNSPIVGCRFDPTGRYVFFGAQDSRVWRWDWAAGKKVELKGHGSWVRGIAFTPDGQTMLTGGYEGKLIWWSLQGDAPTQLRAVDAHEGWIRAVAVTRDGRTAATVGNDLIVRLWNVADGKKLREMKGHESHIYNVVFHPDGGDLVTGDLKAKLIHWRTTGEKVREMAAESLYKYDSGFRADIGGPRGMVFNRDGSILACSGITNVTNAFAGVGNPSIELLDWTSGKRKIQHLSKGKLRGVGWAVAQHPDGFTIGLSGGGGGGFLLFWKPDEANEFHQLKLPNTARDMDVSSNRIDVITGHYDGHLRIFRMG